MERYRRRANIDPFLLSFFNVSKYTITCASKREKHKQFHKTMRDARTPAHQDALLPHTPLFPHLTSFVISILPHLPNPKNPLHQTHRPPLQQLHQSCPANVLSPTFLNFSIHLPQKVGSRVHVPPPVHLDTFTHPVRWILIHFTVRRHSITECSEAGHLSAT